VYLAPHADTGTIIHEMGHAIEHANEDTLGKKSKAFLAAKTTDQPVEHLGGFFNDFEVATKNGFQNAYTGKYYAGEGSTEVLSMGLQHLYEDAIGFAKESPEHFNYTVAMMQGLIK
jgi:hypothetical protein